MPSTTKQHPSNLKVQFIITGFGPFCGVESNPTTVLVHRLQQLQRQQQQQQQQQQHRTLENETENENENEEDETHRWIPEIQSAQVVETAAASVRKSVDAIYANLHQNENENREWIVVVLHLGVSGSATAYALERTGHNDATFRVPDELGYQPTREPIVSKHPLDHCLQTSLDVEALQHALITSSKNTKPRIEKTNTSLRASGITDNDASSKTHKYATKPSPPPYQVQVSDNPGRFVCNYTYYYSLYHQSQLPSQQTRSEKQGPANTLYKSTLQPRVYTLFLHVPSFTPPNKHASTVDKDAAVVSAAAATAPPPPADECDMKAKAPPKEADQNAKQQPTKDNAWPFSEENQLEFVLDLMRVIRGWIRGQHNIVS